jgi:cell division protein FtsZ
MNNAGSALMGVGEAEGEDRAKKAVESAIDSPLVEADIDGARGVLININGGPDITMAEIEQAARTITDHVAPDANIIFGASIDPLLQGKIKITVIATGFDNSKLHYSSIKKSQVSEPTQEPLLSGEYKDILNDQVIPEGLDIETDFDIPAFLRKNK